MSDKAEDQMVQGLRSERGHGWDLDEEGFRDLGEVIWDVFHEAGLPPFIDVPFGAYLTPGEALHAKEALKWLLEG